ncbi:hypothetical protein FIM02_00885 [SAR202 cluster bacterium AD-802-E10_MRT_200m]|nr:hypothetical protein [SAR202 cluster bacterium AD-802-E10_MRT_200m]
MFMVKQDLPISKTDKNLWNAIIAESLANLKYNSYAMKALEEGHPEIGQIFQEVAGAETIHGINHLRVAGDIKSSVDNLRKVIAGEAQEFSSLYPRMIRDALEEGREDAAHTFSLAMDREVKHLEAFTKALHDLESKLSQQTTIPVEINKSIQHQQQYEPNSRQIEDSPFSDKVIREMELEQNRMARFGRIREVVFGVQDGILSTGVLLTAVAAAVGDSPTIIVAGLATALAGMLSMGSGSYLGSKAEKDVFQAEIEKEAKELEENPAEELAELVFVYHQQGMSYRQAREMAEHISSDKDLWLRTLIEKELGISPDMLQSPMKDGLTMALAFFIGATLPILPYFLLDVKFAVPISITVALLGLFVLGTGKGRLTQKSPLLQGLEILIVGAIATGMGYLLGKGVEMLFG